MKGAMAAVCERVVALVDHTKLNQVGLATFAPLSSLGDYTIDDFNFYIGYYT